MSISDAFLNFWKIYIKFYYCKELEEKNIASYFIADIIFSSFLAEIALKAIIAYERNEICRGHYLDLLFMNLHPQTRNLIASDMGYTVDELLIKLKANNNHFIYWRYHFELQCNEVDLKFIENLLNSISAYVIGLRMKLNVEHEAKLSCE